MKSGKIGNVLISAGLTIAGLTLSTRAMAAGYVVTKLVSDQPGEALLLDANLVNPWGLAASGTSPLWVANNATSTSSIYTSTLSTSATINALVVSTPPGGGITGIVFNGGSSFALPTGGGARFIFASEDGSISAWNGAQGTIAITQASVVGANYKGLAIGNNGTVDRLYAANFASAAINAFDSTFTPVGLAGSFTDPNLPVGYSPFNIRNINGRLYVAYALRNPVDNDEIAGVGAGLLDVYDLEGQFIQRLINPGGQLNAPWGLELAPASFGEFSGDLLVGNFGDGRINAYDPVAGTFQGTLLDPSANPIALEGLWGINFGNGGNGGESNVLYFTAGPDNETHGLFGSIAVPEPGVAALLCGLSLIFARRRRI